VVEKFDNNGVALTKQTIKKAVIEIGRNQLDDIVLRMTHEDSKGKANQIQGNNGCIDEIICMLKVLTPLDNLNYTNNLLTKGK
jgi:hypothetical protein